jgi:hypothetical protein
MLGRLYIILVEFLGSRSTIKRRLDVTANGELSFSSILKLDISLSASCSPRDGDI